MHTEAIKASASKRLIYWFIGVYVFELTVAFMPLRGLWLNASDFRWLTDFMAGFIPVIRKVDAHLTPDFEARRLYMTMVVCLFPVKVALIYKWLNANFMSNYRHFVISPLTDKQPMNANEFVAAPVLDENGVVPEQKPRSMFSRVMWSILIVFLSILFVWAILQGKSLNSTNLIDYRRYWGGISRSDFGVFFRLSGPYAMILGLFLAASLCVLRDWVIFIKDHFLNEKR